MIESQCAWRYAAQSGITGEKTGMNRFAKATCSFLSNLLVSVLLAALAATAAFAAPHTVRVGWYTAAGMQDGADVSSLGGYNYEYLSKIAQYADWQLEYVFGSWPELEQMLTDGRIDIIGDVGKSAARMKKYDYCDYPSGYSRMLMVSRQSDDRFAYNDYRSFDGITVADMNSDFRKSLLNREARAHGFHVNYKNYATEKELFAALDRGETDAAIFSNVSAYHGYKVISEWEPNPFYFVVSKKRPDLLQELNAALRQIQTADLFMQERLFDKYFGENGADSTVALTRAELAYLKTCGPVTVLLSRNQKPLSYEKYGKIAGLIPDYLTLLAKKTGLRFKYVVCNNFSELAGRFQAGDGMIFAQFPDSYRIARRFGAYITQPFYTLQYGLVFHPGAQNSLKTVAIEKGKIFIAKKLEAAGYSIREYPGEKDCLEAAAAGSVDAAAVSSLSYEQMSYHARFSGLIFQSQPQFNISICLAISKKAGNTLYSIVEKGAGIVRSSTVSGLALANSVLKPEYTFYDYLYMYAQMLYLLLALSLLALFFFLWYYRERRLNRSLQKAKLEADAANQSKSTFLSCMSHDLRTPLNGIVGFTDFALRESDPVKKQGYLEKIKAAAALLADLVEDTLELSRIESGKMVLEQEAVDGEKLGRAVVMAVKPVADLKGVSLLADADSYPHETIWADRLKIQKILLNLLSNAIKYTPRGGVVSLRISEIDQPTDGRTRRIVVEDNGIGMSPEFLTRLYEPFAQELRPEAKNVTGTGLGLAIVKRIVDLMNGTIEVASEVGRGTRFTVELPLTRVGEVQQRTAPDADTASLAGKRVLLCEDNEMNAEIATILLQEQGLLVETAVNGREGLAKFSGSAPGYYALVLMDIRMPVMDGLAAARAIRRLDRSDARTVPIVAMSADAFEEDLRRARETGMNGYVTKPVDPYKLRQVLLDNIRR